MSKASLGPVRRITGLRGFRWPEFSALVVSTGGTTHPYTDAPGRWSEDMRVVGAADFLSSGCECNIHGEVPNSFILGVTRWSAGVEKIDDAALDAVFPSHKGRWLPEGDYIVSGPWSVMVTGTQLWRVHCVLAGKQGHAVGLSLPDVRASALSSLASSLAKDMCELEDEIRIAEQRVGTMQAKRWELTACISACDMLRMGGDAVGQENITE